MEFNQNKPIYLQLADLIMDRVQKDEVQPGERLPSVREFAAANGVNANTVMRTYTQLQQDGIIYNQRGIGYFYSGNALGKVQEIRMREVLDKEIYYFMDRLESAYITPDQFREMYIDYLRKKKK